MCNFQNCSKAITTKGYCSGHYQQIWRGEELKPLKSRPGNRSLGNLTNSNGQYKCASCKLWKNSDDFTVSKANSTGKCSYCKDCSREKQLQAKFKITLSEYAEMLERQNGVCAICKTSPGQMALAVDHDHNCCPGQRTCGKCIRGLLCINCNTAVGLLKDSSERAMDTATYLMSFENVLI